MTLITRASSGDYRKRQYVAMHSDGKFKGATWKRHLETLTKVIPDISKKTILDYGCGPTGGLREHLRENVISYDPYVSQHSTPPWDKQFDVLFSCDVLEHMTVGEVKELLDRALTANVGHVFLVVSTRPAVKRLPNGANAHITVRSADWWLDHIQQVLGPTYTPGLAISDLLQKEVILCFVRGGAS